MMPPISLIQIVREIEYRETKRKLFLLSEGTLTEPSFLESILSGSPYFSSNRNVEFYKTERSGREHGINTLNGMIDIAYRNIINKKDIGFRKKKDKVVIFFDLDIYHDSINEVKQLINEHKKYIIFVFVNPAIELFLLLCKENSYEQLVQPHIKEILENNKTSETGNRYIYQLVIDSIGIDPKDPDADFSVFSNGLQNAINQEKIYLSKKLVDPNANLISNFGTVIEKIKNGEFDNIDYSILN